HDEAILLIRSPEMTCRSSAAFCRNFPHRQIPIAGARAHRFMATDPRSVPYAPRGRDAVVFDYRGRSHQAAKLVLPSRDRLGSAFRDIRTAPSRLAANSLHCTLSTAPACPALSSSRADVSLTSA